MEIQFVNYRGEPMSPPPLRSLRQERREKPVINSFHKGWRVQGIPPDALEKARYRHSMLVSAGRESKPFSEQDWLRNATRKPVRAKPYSIPDAAQTCAELATKAGWLRVEVVAIEKKPLNT